MKKINSYIKVLATLNEEIEDVLSKKEIPAVVVFENENGKRFYRNEVIGINPKHITKISSNRLELTKTGFEHYYLMGLISKNSEYYFMQVNDYNIWEVVSGILFSE